MYKIDLHTHSQASPDGSLTSEQYRHIIKNKKLDYIAVTDHDRIDFATTLSQELGDAIIVGQEITTREGEIIGLYLSCAIPKGLSAKETVDRIRDQNGIVYIPHPFENLRNGLQATVLNTIADEVDIVEAYNGRAVFQNRSSQTLHWSEDRHKPAAASSDAHGVFGWGRTYTLIDAPPTSKTLVNLLQKGRYVVGFPGVIGIIYPKFNRLRKAF